MIPGIITLHGELIKTIRNIHGNKRSTINYTKKKFLCVKDENLFYIIYMIVRSKL